MRTLIILLSLWLIQSVGSANQISLGNQVANHPSPYLAMHGQDPVHWQLWSRETLLKAQTLNKPLLVSIGYFSCHWCHVMQKESYRDPALAKLLNTHFIPVKIDRELEPALDAHLIDFVMLTRGHAGWPLNVFLTPEGIPLIGLTYAPRDKFYAVLEEINKLWQKDANELIEGARANLKTWRKVQEPKAASTPITNSLIELMLQQTKRRADTLEGGFGEQTKFPMTAELNALLWIRARGNDQSLDDFLRVTLDAMAFQGLHDEVGNGFFRYVTDPTWQIPHFEKMLYDNAQLALLYLNAGHEFQSQEYTKIGLDTLDFMLENMKKADGSFLSSFSAVDDLGREGFYYLWKQRTWMDLLDKNERKAVASAWFSKNNSIDSEFGTLPRWQGTPEEVAKKLAWSVKNLHIKLNTARSKLREHQRKRTLLADNKSLASWNGLVLSALTSGYERSEDPKYLQAGQRLSDYLLNQLWDGKQLARALNKGQVLASASLEDYALVAQGLWDWCSLLESKPCLEVLRKWFVLPGRDSI